jgi:hypothetical protein
MRSSLAYTTSTYNNLNLLDPSSVGVFQAKVTPVTYQNPQGEDIVARLSGRFYNDGTPGGGYLGEVGAEVRIGGTGASPVGQWDVWTYSDTAGNNTQGITSGLFAKPIVLGSTYTLLLKWDGRKFTFQLDDEVAYYTPATSINPTRYPWKGLVTRVKNPTGQEAVIEALFDDVVVTPSVDVYYVSSDSLCSSNHPCFTNLQSAITSVSGPSIIKVTQETYGGNIQSNIDEIVTLQGGWNTSFASNSSRTTIQGSLTITYGTIIIENIILK